ARSGEFAILLASDARARPDLVGAGAYVAEVERERRIASVQPLVLQRIQHDGCGAHRGGGHLIIPETGLSRLVIDGPRFPRVQRSAVDGKVGEPGLQSSLESAAELRAAHAV